MLKKIKVNYCLEENNVNVFSIYLPLNLYIIFDKSTENRTILIDKWIGDEIKVLNLNEDNSTKELDLDYYL